MTQLWARTIRQVLEQEYPAATHHVMRGPADTATPRELHPAFYGSFDWHSAVHMLATGIRLQDKELFSLIDARLTPQNLTTELAYLKDNSSFERPYGWAWALQLAQACRTHGRQHWVDAVEPLRQHLIGAVQTWLAAQELPVRHGVHGNSALALLLVWEAEEGLRGVIKQKALEWFAADRDYPYQWELSAHDFVSNGLAELCLMRRVHPDFDAWAAQFMPEEAYEFYRDTPAGDPADGHGAHLLGLAWTRAWMLRELGKPATIPDPGELTGEHFMATHWLITYAWLALR